MLEGIDYIKHKIKCKDIFLSAMKTWNTPEETDEDKAARIKLENMFKTVIVTDAKFDPISEESHAPGYANFVIGNEFKGFPEALGNKFFCRRVGFTANFFFADVKCQIVFREIPEENCTVLLALRWGVRCFTSEAYLLRTTQGRPLKLYEVWSSYKEGINIKGKDLW